MLQRASLLPASDQRVCLRELCHWGAGGCSQGHLVQCVPEYRGPSIHRTGFYYFSLCMGLITTSHRGRKVIPFLSSGIPSNGLKEGASVLCWPVSKSSSNSCHFLFLRKKDKTSKKLQPSAGNTLFLEYNGISWFMVLIIRLYSIYDNNIGFPSMGTSNVLS